ncbi:MAG: MmeII [Lactobacillales bacterium]|nr:MmeII [Lactobacillales bacterium]
MKNRKQDEAWNCLFEQFKIINQITDKGYFEISSHEINEMVRYIYQDKKDKNGKTINAPDARNLLKFDFKVDLPNIFKKSQNGFSELSIMPRGSNSYRISDYKTYQSLDYKLIPKIELTFPSWISGIEPTNITSESVAQSVAEMSGMFNYVIEDLGVEIVATLNGKKGTGIIDFKIEKYNGETDDFRISGWQSEIDGIYESPNKVLVLETKLKNPVDFNIRQLYLPLRIYSSQMKFCKQIYTAYFTYVRDVFSFHVYEFSELVKYNSLKKVKQYDFVLKNSDGVLNREIVESILRTAKTEEEPVETPFPQANDTDKMLDLINFLSEEGDIDIPDYGCAMPRGSKYAIANNYEMDERQGDYYGNLLRYFGLANKTKEKGFVLNELGKCFNEKNSFEQNKMFVSQLVKRKIFNELLTSRIKSKEQIGKERIKAVIRKYRPELSEDTVERRSSTVNSIVEWVATRFSF